MAEYELTIVFEADDDEDADEQVDEALDAFDSIVRERLEGVSRG